MSNSQASANLGPAAGCSADRSCDAFCDRVLRQHARMLYRVAYSVLRHPADAEDAVSDALVKLIRNGAWKGITHERAFLARTVWRTALDHFNSRSSGQEPSEPDMLELCDPQPSPETCAIQGEQRQRLHTLMDRLPLDLREPLLLAAVQELNSREIGEALHLPEGTVRTRLMRARQQLRQQYEDWQHYRCKIEIAAGGSR